MSEIVYVFANEAMPNLIKIGRTSRGEIQQRLDELYNSHTGVPVPFTCLCRVEVNDAELVEKALHTAFKDDRINPRREFFKTPPYKIIALLRAFAIPGTVVLDELNDNTTPEEELAIARAATENARRSNLKFSDIEIPIGAELIFEKDETKKCTVINDNQVEYGGQIYSLSKLAKKFFLELGNNRTATQGAAHFLYEGELLRDRRDRMEMERETEE